MPSMWAKASQGSRSKDMPVNFTSLGVGAHSASLRRRVSRDVFTVARGQNFVAGKATAGMEPILNKTSITLADPASNTFTVQLNKEPINKTKVTIDILHKEQLSVNIREIIFDKSNWNIPQLIPIDATENIDINTLIHVNVLYGASKSISVMSETKSFIISPESLSLVQGVQGQQFTIGLSDIPTRGISFEITSSDPEIIISTPVVEFIDTIGPTATFFDTNDDKIADGNVNASITIAPVTGGAPEYAVLPSKTLPIFLSNPNVAGVSTNYDANDKDIQEGTTKDLSISLTSNPTGTVTITPTSSNSKITVSPVQFTPGDYENKTMTFSGVSDGVYIDDVDVDISFAITNTDANEYQGVTMSDIVYTYKNVDVQLTTNLSSLTITEGGNQQVEVTLSNVPNADIEVGIDLHDATNFKVENPTTYTFTAGNADLSTNFTISARRDYKQLSIADSSMNFKVNSFGGDSRYQDASAAVILAFNDIDTAGITTSLVNQIIDEGNAVNFDISLATHPTDNVTLDITTGNAALTVSPTSVTLAPTDAWDTANNVGKVQSITLTAENGNFSNGTYDISIVAVNSAATEYTGLSLVRQITYQGDRVECISPTSVVKIFDSKYTFNDKSAYEDVSYGLTQTIDTSYVLQDISSDHPIALLNNGISQVTYSPVDNTINPIEIKVSGGFSGDPYYTFKDKDDTTITIGPNNTDFKFMRGRTYKFTAQADDIDSDHPFELFVNGSTTTSIDETGGDITITISSGHSTTQGDLYYQCSSHGSNMRKNMYLTYALGPDNINSYDFYYGDVNVGVSAPFDGALSVYCLKHGYMGGQDLIVYKDTCTAPTSA